MVFIQKEKSNLESNNFKPRKSGAFFNCIFNHHTYSFESTKSLLNKDHFTIFDLYLPA